MSTGLGQALSVGYSRFFGTAESREKNAHADREQPVPVAEEAAPVIHEDGFDEAAAQAHIDGIVDGYMSVEVNGAEVATEYRNTATRSGYHDPVYGGLDEPTMYQRHPEMYYCIMGKASPSQLHVALEEAVASGVIHKAVGKKAGEPLTGEEIEEWNADHFGVDCIGLVMNTLLTEEEYEDFVPSNTDGSDFERYMAVNCRHFEASSEAVADPEDWRALDVITWTGSKGAGHVIVIRDVARTAEGSYTLHCIESAGSSGPRLSTYTYIDGEFSGVIPERATVRRASVEDTQPIADALEGA